MLAILTTHPIQYQVPLWQALERDGRIPFEVWYLTDHGVNPSHDPQFDQAFAWDLDMLAGYPHRFLDVVPGATPNSFWKCRVRESLGERMRASNVKALWIQGWQVAAYWQAVWAAKEIGTEVWLRGESNDLAATPFWKRAVKRVILGQLFHRVGRFLYIGSANRRLYKKFGVPDDRLYPAPYAVDNERFARQAAEIRDQPPAESGLRPGGKLEIRSQWGISDDAFCVLFCGKFIGKKRPLDLVKAARLLQQDGKLPNIHLLFVGSGELGADLRASCAVVFDAEVAQQSEVAGQRSEEAKPRASFAGFLNQTEISKAYVVADCLVLPSDYHETWGLVVNEAMVSGLRCIISNQCGCAQDLGSLANNRIFECGDIGQLAKTIYELAESSEGTIGNVAQPPPLMESISTVSQLYKTIGSRE